MGFAILAIGIVVFALWGLKNPFAGLVGLTLATIIQPGELYPLFAAIHVERLLFAVIAISTFLHGHRITIPKVTRNLIFLWASLLWSIPFAVWQSNSVEMLFRFSIIVAFHVLIVTLVKTETQFRIIIATFITGIFWLAASSTYAYYHGQLYFAQGIERAVGLTSSGNNPNSLGISLVSALPLAGLLIIDKWSKPIRLFAAVMVVASVWAVVITGSRTAFAALAFVVFVALFSRKKNIIYVPVVVGIAALVWSLMPPQYVQRYGSVGDLGKDASYQNRLLAWRAGTDMFLDRPLTGVGTGNFAVAAGAEYWPGTGRKHWLNAHSLFFQIIGELGLPGLLAFCWFLIHLFRLNFNLKRELQDAPCGSAIRGFPLACILSLLVLLVASYAGHTLYRNTWYILAAFTAAVEGMTVAARAARPVADPEEQKVREDVLAQG